jgi:hypothetical protein
MRSLLLSVLLSVITASQIRAEAERELFSRVVDVLPKASPGEFKTPDSVARCFVQGIIDNHIQDTFRCIPLSRMFAADTFENRVRYVGNVYSAKNHDLLPDDDYGRYLTLLSQYHYIPVQKCRIALLLASDPSKTNLLEKLQSPGDKDPAVVNKWIEKLAKDLSFQNLTNAAISSVKSEPRNAELKHLGVLPFKDIHKVTIHVSVQGSDVPITFLVGSVDGNYQIRSLID